MDLGKIWVYDVGEQLAVPQPDEWNKFAHTLQELKNNKIEEDLDRGLSGAGHHLASLGSQGVPSMQVLLCLPEEYNAFCFIFKIIISCPESAQWPQQSWFSP